MSGIFQTSTGGAPDSMSGHLVADDRTSEELLWRGALAKMIMLISFILAWVHYKCGFFGLGDVLSMSEVDIYTMQREHGTLCRCPCIQLHHS